MDLYDQHIHSKHSFDSQAEPAHSVLRAIEYGLAGVSFTEHYDTHPDERDGCVYDHAAYSATINRLRDRFGSSVRVGKGIEVDYQAENMPAIVDFLDGGGFDIVLLSVHWSKGKPIHQEAAWDGLDPSRVTRDYLVSVLDAVRHCERLQRGRSPIFNVLGHLDFCKRYSKRFAGVVCVDEHLDVVDEILVSCLESGLIPEVNTSTLRNDMPDPMPGAAAVRRYADLGGRMMSLGSDAHRATQVSANFDLALSILRAGGIEKLAVFHDRRASVEPIGGANSECGMSSLE